MYPLYNAEQELEIWFPEKEGEPFYQQYQLNLEQINQIVINSKQSMEGNMMFNNHSVPSSKPYVPFLDRRQNLCSIATTHNVLVEIGFNAGHSALLALTANPNLKYYGIDIGRHRYIQPCFDYLKQEFGDRISLEIGNSAIVMPQVMPLLIQQDHFRQGNVAWCIDGGHDIAPAAIDMANILTYAQDGDILLFDDSDFPKLRSLLDFYLIRGDLISIKKSATQDIFRIMKRMLR